MEYVDTIRGSHPGHATVLLVSNLWQLFTHIASPVFSAPRNWGTKVSIRTGPI